MFAWEGDPGSVKAWKAAGFNPVVLSSTDVITSLQTGMIECIPNVPLYVLTARLFEKAPYMIDVPWGWLVGATIVRKDAWDKIPADLRPKLLAIAKDLGKRVDAEVAKLNTEAVTAMEKQGLKVVKVDAAAWRVAGREVLAGGARRGGAGRLLRRGEGAPRRPAGRQEVGNPRPPGALQGASVSARGEGRHLAPQHLAAEEERHVAAGELAERDVPGARDGPRPAHGDGVVASPGDEDPTGRRAPPEGHEPTEPPRHLLAGRHRRTGALRQSRVALANGGLPEHRGQVRRRGHERRPVDPLRPGGHPGSHERAKGEPDEHHLAALGRRSPGTGPGLEHRLLEHLPHPAQVGRDHPLATALAGRSTLQVKRGHREPDLEPGARQGPYPAGEDGWTAELPRGKQDRRAAPPPRCGREANRGKGPRRPEGLEGAVRSRPPGDRRPPHHALDRHGEAVEHAVQGTPAR